MSMRRWRVEGVDKVTGEPKSEIVNARIEDDARAWGFDQNWYVSKIVDVGPVPLPPGERVSFWTGKTRKGLDADTLKSATFIRGHKDAPIPVEIHRRSHNELILTIAFGIVLGHIFSAILAAMIFCSGIAGTISAAT